MQPPGWQRPHALPGRSGARSSPAEGPRRGRRTRAPSAVRRGRLLVAVAIVALGFLPGLSRGQPLGEGPPMTRRYRHLLVAALVASLALLAAPVQASTHPDNTSFTWD